MNNPTFSKSVVLLTTPVLGLKGIGLTHFMSLVSFGLPWKHQKTRVYLGVLKETIGMKWVERLLLWKLPVKDISQNFAFPNIALRAVLNKCVHTSVSKLFRYFVFASTFLSNALTAIFTKCSSTTLLLFSFGLATSWFFFVLSFFSSSWKKVWINKVNKPSEKKYITKDLLKHLLYRCLLRILPNE